MKAVALWLLLASCVVRASSIELFVLQPQALPAQQGVTVYALEPALQLSHIKLEESSAKSWLASHHAALQQAFRGLYLTHQYGLTQFPAIVFDHQAVVEGTTDIAMAQGEFNKWRSESLSSYSR